MKALSRRRVLIVEDDLDMLELLQSWAENQGCDVRTCRSGQQALEVSVAFKPRVLIADYVLEDDLTGVDVISRVRNLGVDPRCVLITGVLHKALRESLNRINGLIILAKPLDLGRLQQIVATA